MRAMRGRKRHRKKLAKKGLREWSRWERAPRGFGNYAGTISRLNTVRIVTSAYLHGWRRGIESADDSQRYVPKQ